MDRKAQAADRVDWLNRLADQTRAQIMAEEDKKIFEALDAMASKCWNELHHPGIPEVYRLDCPHEDCWVSEIMES